MTTSYRHNPWTSPVRLLGRGVQRVWLVVLLLALWELVRHDSVKSYFPPPSAILAAVRELWFTGPADRLFLNENAVDDFSSSLGHLFGGWLLACTAGILIGVLIGRSRVTGDVLEPLLQFLRAVPPPTLLPFFIVVFQLGPTMSMATIAFGVVWPVLLNTADGVRTVDPLQLETAEVFGLGRFRRLMQVIMPAALPKIAAGLRVSLGFALILMVISELVGSTAGIGAELISAQRSFQTVDMWAGIAVLGILGYLLNEVFLLLERHFLAWHVGARRLES